MEMAMGIFTAIRLGKMMNTALIFSFLLIISCKSYQEIVRNDTSCHFDTIVIQEEMTFDVQKYDSILSKGQITVRDDMYFNIRYWRLSGGGYINMQTNKQTNITKMIRYYPSGKVRNCYFEYGDIELGTETHFDTLGNITKVIDHDKGYTVCWAQAIEIVKHKLERKLAKYDSVSFVLTRTNPDSRPEWKVGILPEPDDRPDETDYYRIDGITGKYLGKLTVITTDY